MVFVGPASRENAGFNHSYDIILDSYAALRSMTNSGSDHAFLAISQRKISPTLPGTGCRAGSAVILFEESALQQISHLLDGSSYAIYSIGPTRSARRLL